MVAIALIVVELVLGRAWLVSAADAVRAASWRGIVVAAALSVASMWCFGAVRQRTLRAAGVEVPVTAAVAMSYAAGAIHTTLPGGAVFATAYTFRQLRRWGSPMSVATWSLAITGVLAAATLAVVGLGGIVLGGGLAVSADRLAIEIAVLIIILVAMAQLTRRPHRLLPAALAGLRLVNRVRRRPAASGSGTLTAVILDLQTIRPTGRQWTVALALSLGNWLFDAACLALCCSAVGLHLSLPAILLTYTAGMAAVSVSPLPAGIGIVEGALAIGLTAAGGAAPAALAAVLIYRLISTGGVAAIGWAVLGRERRGSAPGRRRPPRRVIPGRDVPVIKRN
jgi:uncharacterized protein (TIRG00374 family)